MQLVWLKRDLRIRDHKPLRQAAKRGPTLALYVYEPELYERPERHPQHIRFINQSLQELRQNLRKRGGRLILRVGNLPHVFQDLHDQYTINGLWAHEETGLMVTYRRDERVRRWCDSRGIPFHEFPQVGVFRGLQDRDGWSDRWHERMSKPHLDPPPDMESPDQPESIGLQSPEDLGLPNQSMPEAQTGGESEALITLNGFLHKRGEPYQSAMSSPVTAWDHCSRLSTYLAWGCISMKMVYQKTKTRQQTLRDQRDQGSDTGTWLSALQSFLKRLHWRGHFMQKLEDEPSIEFRNLARSYDGLREDEFNQRTFEAWKNGRTGFPMVDACMRALHQAGWINFRMRALLMSFSSYHLWNHWRKPAVHLARYFLDFEPGIHFPQVQMQSGTTGINSIRIYNPTKQVHDHDPDGEFIRQYVPELQDVPKQYLAEPASMPGYLQRKSNCVIGEDYPEPIVDGEEAYKQANDRIWAVKNSDEAQREADKIYEKHGSRRND